MENIGIGYTKLLVAWHYHAGQKTMYQDAIDANE